MFNIKKWRKIVRISQSVIFIVTTLFLTIGDFVEHTDKFSKALWPVLGILSSGMLLEVLLKLDALEDKREKIDISANKE